jgi:hypothetical protein
VAVLRLLQPLLAHSDEFDDAQIARILNRQGRRSGRGLAFTKESITSLRGKNRIPIAPKPEPRDEREGPFTLDDAARELGVTTATVQCWLRADCRAGIVVSIAAAGDLVQWNPTDTCWPRMEASPKTGLFARSGAGTPMP